MHNIIGMESFIEHLKRRKIGIWGSGKSSEYVERELVRYGINNWSYFDNDSIKIVKAVWKGKSLYSPEILKEDKEWYIVVASVYYYEIAEQLKSYGLEEFKDFINGRDIEMVIWEHSDSEHVIRDITFEQLNMIEQEIYKEGIHAEKYNIDYKKFEQFVEEFYISQFFDKTNTRRKRKLLEYYLAYTFLGLEKFSNRGIGKYVDIGSCMSPWVKELRERLHINAFGLDYQSKPFEESYYIVEDATATSFKDGEIDAISLQSAFEMFMGDADQYFVDEAARILRQGGKLIIAPLYMYTEFISTVSPEYYGSGMSDTDAVEKVRLDCHGVNIGRFYDVRNLKKRVINRAENKGMKTTVHILPNEQVEKDGFVYLKFFLEMEKQ